MAQALRDKAAISQAPYIAVLHSFLRNLAMASAACSP
jgi:hypothetical protein